MAKVRVLFALVTRDGDRLLAGGVYTVRDAEKACEAALIALQRQDTTFAWNPRDETMREDETT